MKTEDHQLTIFTWHIHGSYLYYLSQGNYRIYIPVTPQKQEGYYGRGNTFPFGDNVIEVPAEEVKNIHFDCILYQTNKNWLVDQYEILSEEQRKLPRIYLEHDPPSHHPTDTKHVMNDPDVIMVHVSHFNKLMWNNSQSKIIKVIDHGVISPAVNYSGKLEKGIVVVNHLHQRGRKLGADIFTEVSKHVPLDLIGMGTKEYGGLGEVLHPQLPEFISHYRFFFNPIRYTSLGLAVIEAMMTGIPVVALATTEYVTMIKNYETGFIDTDIDFLINKMQLLLINKPWATDIGARGKSYAEERFSIDRFTEEWKNTFLLAITKNENYEKENSLYQ
ncbi:MAG TPA: glycosyltransferase family 4 protein [Hanamia sp.]|jgi:glycosyltransferase involved in cell wall biosynthesis|nr:glycosyltransferase family 4 protein [Hanamia sp.]